MPLFGEEGEIVAPDEARAMLVPLNLIPQEDLPWHPVRGLVPAEPAGSEGYQVALRESAPESGSFILFSLRRRSAKSQRSPRGKRGKGT
jgi:hypothetical protein